MDPALVQSLVSATIRALDLMDRFNTSFNSQEELNQYLKERNQVRGELVDLANRLSESDSSPAPSAGDDLGHGYRNPSSEEEGDSEGTTLTQS